MSKGFNMLREYIEHDALCMRRGKCCDIEYELQQEFAALESENASLRGAAQGLGELCDRYKAENDKLRKFAKIDTEDIDTMSCLVDDLRAENAKLREVCERLIQTVRVAESVSDCGLLDKRFEGELRDMGFEVGA